MSVEREPSGRYLARFSFTDGAGIRRHRKRRFDKKKDADAWLSQQRADVSRGVYFEPSRDRLGTVLDQWADRLEGTGRSAATVYAYRSAVRLRFDAVRDVPLADLTPAMLGRLIDRWRGEGLADRTIRQARMVLRMVLDEAVADRLLLRNPLDGVKRPLADHPRAVTWTAADVRTFLAATDGTPAHDLWVLLFATLARIGELCALRWEDIEGDRLHIRRTWTKTARGRLVLGEATKTAAGARVVPLLPAVAARLERMRDSRGFDDGGWVCWLNGQPARPDQVRTAWRKAVAATGLPALTPHGARHAGATALLAAGVSPAVVQRLLGHTTPGFTLRVYAHVRAEDAAPGLATLGALYGLEDGPRAQSAPNVVRIAEKRRVSGEKVRGQS